MHRHVGRHGEAVLPAGQSACDFQLWSNGITVSEDCRLGVGAPEYRLGIFLQAGGAAMRDIDAARARAACWSPRRA